MKHAKTTETQAALTLNLRRIRKGVRTEVNTGAAKTKCAKITCLFSACGPGSLGRAEE